MIVKMKKYEKQAIDNAKKYKKWELQCVSKDSYLEGYRNALLDVSDNYSDNVVDNHPATGQDIISDSFNIHNTGSELVEVEFTNGSHQLVDDIRISNAILQQKQQEEYNTLCSTKTFCKECGTETEPGVGSARCPSCWEDRCGNSC